MSTATKTRNASVKKSGLGRTPVAPSPSVFALMVSIDWTDAATVTITARKDFELPAVSVDTRTGQVVSQVPARVPAGTVLYFVKSSFTGYYYISHVNASGKATCTCGHYQNLKNCKHQPFAESFYQVKVQRAKKSLLAVLTAKIEQEASPAEKLKTATPEERRSIWKNVAMREKRLAQERAASYWQQIKELQEAAKAPVEAAYVPTVGDKVMIHTGDRYNNVHGMVVDADFEEPCTKEICILVSIGGKKCIFQVSELVLVESAFQPDESIDEEARINAYLSDELAIGA